MRCALSSATPKALNTTPRNTKALRSIFRAKRSTTVLWALDHPAHGLELSGAGIRPLLEGARRLLPGAHRQLQTAQALRDRGLPAREPSREGVETNAARVNLRRMSAKSRRRPSLPLVVQPYWHSKAQIQSF